MLAYFFNPFLFGVIGFILSMQVGAEETASVKKECAQAVAKNQQNNPIYFMQYLFGDGTRDLALTQTLPAKISDIKRVTFNKNIDCVYQTLAIAEGFNESARWGWHLAWADDNYIYYARMDGEAWVSSVPKKIVAKNASDLHFTQNGGLLILDWKVCSESFSMVSDDEGRSWSASKN